MEQNIEERFAQIESRVAELERQRSIQEDRDMALLARIDGFIDDLRRVERVQMRGFDTLMAGQKSLDARMTSVETTIGVVAETVEALSDRMGALADQVNTLVAGQAQILARLANNPGNND